MVSLVRTTPADLGCRRSPWAGARGTYSFMVCRLCRFPLRVRYMPRSISEESPTLRLRRCELSGLWLLPPTGFLGFRGKCAPQRAGAPAGARALCLWNPGRMTGLQAQARLGLRQAEPGNGRDQRGGSREKQPCWPTLRGSVKGACVCKGQPLGPAPGRKPDPVICDPPPLFPWQQGGGKSANCWAGRREGRRLCPPGWQD